MRVPLLFAGFAHGDHHLSIEANRLHAFEPMEQFLKDHIDHDVK